IPRWGELSRAGVAIYDIDFDAILSAMYAVSISDEGACYRCFPPDPGIQAAALGTGEAAALGACDATALGASASASSGTGESALSGTASTLASVTFTLDSGASRTTLTPLSRPVAVSLADPSEAPILSHFSTVLPCPAAPSGTLSGLYLPSFSTNLVFAAASRSGPESAPCSCRLLSHETLLWHHRLGHPSLLRLRGMASRFLVSGLPRSLPPLPQGPGPTCVPCVEGRQRAAPHSSHFPPTEAPLQTLHMDVWGPARVRGQGHERYFLLVVDDYSRYTTVFPLRSKGDVTEVLIDWIHPATEPPSSRAALPSSRFCSYRRAPALLIRTDGLSLFDLTSGASRAPPATADSTVRSQWATRDAAARLAVRRHLPTTERAHFSQYKSAQTLYDAIVARYSSPTTAALSRLKLPYLFPDLAAFPTVADLITHLRTSDTRYRAALPAEFRAQNPPPPCTSPSTT
ncbi:unnamed protein product, partial [Closterium sp. NIES-53]